MTKIKDILEKIVWLPFKKGQSELLVPIETFYKNLDRNAEKGWDIFRSWNVDNNKKFEFQYQINQNKFKIRQIRNYGYFSAFIATILYGKIVKSDKVTTLHYFTTFNVFGSAIFLVNFAGIFEGLHRFIITNFNDTFLLTICTCIYFVSVSFFSSMAKDDVSFVKSLVSYSNKFNNDK